MKIHTPYGKTKIYRSEGAGPNAEQVLVVPGYTETVVLNKELVDVLGAKGFNALTFSQPRRRNKGRNNTDAIERQGDVLLEVLASMPNGGDKKFHAVSHSLGSAALLKAAIRAPERFSDITIMQPVGMAGYQSLTELAGRACKKTVRNTSKSFKGQKPYSRSKADGYAALVDEESALKYTKRVARSQLASVGLVARQIKLALDEALHLRHYDIAGDVAKVAELGIPVSIVSAHKDDFYDPDKVYAYMDSHVPDTVSVSAVADPEAGHDTFWMQPERTARIISQLIHKV